MDCYDYEELDRRCFDEVWTQGNLNKVEEFYSVRPENLYLLSRNDLGRHPEVGRFFDPTSTWVSHRFSRLG